MTDRIITREITAHHAWQGPESEAPVTASTATALISEAEITPELLAKIRAAGPGPIMAMDAPAYVIPHDCPISVVATWLLDQASRDYRQHEIDALRAAGAILAALEGGTAFCNDGPQLAALGAESNIKKFNIAPSGDLISREAAVALVEAECSRILSKQDGKNDAVDMNIRFIALMLPEIAAAIRALPAQGQPAATQEPEGCRYSPDVMAGGDDCRLCGHPWARHRDARILSALEDAQ